LNKNKEKKCMIAQKQPPAGIIKKVTILFKN